jgi:hypothetical protein
MPRELTLLGGAAKPALLLTLGFSVLRAGAGSITLIPSADTSLIEIAPTNNNGGQAWLLSGKIQNDVYRVRALMKFDFSTLPTNAIVLSARVTIEVTRQPGDGLANAPFGLYRMLRSWGEGDKVATTVPGQGLPASPGEATWGHAFFPTNAWSVPGGASGVDFSDVESTFQFIYGTGQSPYRFESTPELVADVQGWVNNPQINYGWMLLCDDEATIFTARRFGSREDPNAPPLLEIEYFVPPRIASAQRTGSQFQFNFTTWPGQSYAVEFLDSLSAGDWQTFTNLGLATNSATVSITDAVIGPRRFYRVLSF